MLLPVLANEGIGTLATVEEIGFAADVTNVCALAELLLLPTSPANPAKGFTGALAVDTIPANPENGFPVTAGVTTELPKLIELLLSEAWLLLY